MNIKQIETKIAQSLTKELGVTVEITNRTAGCWTISGTDTDARKAASYLESNGLMVLDSVANFDDEGEQATYCYMTDAK